MRYTGYHFVLYPVGYHFERCNAGVCIWSGTVAPSSFYAVFLSGLERAAVDSHILSKYACSVVVCSGWRLTLHAGDDSLCAEGKMEPLYLAFVCSGGGGPALDRDLFRNLSLKKVCFFAHLEKMEAESWDSASFLGHIC